MSEMNFYDAVDVISGGTPSTKIPEYWDGIIPWLSVVDFGDKNKYVYETEKHITQLGVDNSATKVLNTNDIIISARGTVGAMAMLAEPMAFNQSCFGLRAKPHIMDQDYLFYFLKSYMRNISQKSQGSVFQTINLDTFKAIDFDVPDLDVQKAISNLLSCIDEKIENNTAICSDLEGMAKLLYDYWFVQFDFPDENGKPYKSSGGKMVWNEDLKREIPAGWEVGTVNDIVNVSSEKITLSQIGSRVYVPIEAIPRNKMSFSETADIDKAATGLCQFEEKAILLSNRRVYFHKVSISPFDGITRDTVIIMYPKKSNNLGYVYQVVNSNHFIEYATHNSYGTEQPVLATPTALEYKFPYPINSELDIRYSLKVQSMIDKVLELQKENMQLASLRDFLLPMLMNGQVKIKNDEA